MAGDRRFALAAPCRRQGRGRRVLHRLSCRVAGRRSRAGKLSSKHRLVSSAVGRAGQAAAAGNRRRAGESHGDAGLAGRPVVGRRAAGHRPAQAALRVPRADALEAQRRPACHHTAGEDVVQGNGPPVGRREVDCPADRRGFQCRSVRQRPAGGSRRHGCRLHRVENGRQPAGARQSRPACVAVLPADPGRPPSRRQSPSRPPSGSTAFGTAAATRNTRPWRKVGLRAWSPRPIRPRRRMAGRPPCRCGAGDRCDRGR